MTILLQGNLLAVRYRDSGENCGAYEFLVQKSPDSGMVIQAPQAVVENFGLSNFESLVGKNLVFPILVNSYRDINEIGVVETCFFYVLDLWGDYACEFMGYTPACDPSIDLRGSSSGLHDVLKFPIFKSLEVRMSLLLQGKFLGARNREFTNSSGSYNFYELGVENLRPDGWGGQQSVQTAVRIPKKFVDAGVLDKFQRLVGKNVLVPVWVDAYSGKNGAAVQITLESDQIDILPDQK